MCIMLIKLLMEVGLIKHQPVRMRIFYLREASFEGRAHSREKRGEVVLWPLNMAVQPIQQLSLGMCMWMAIFCVAWHAHACMCVR